MREFYVEDKSKFEAITDLDGIIFLSGYQGDPDSQEQGENGGTKSKNSYFGFVFTSKHLLTDCFTALVEHADTGGICTGFDGTFNLCKKGWVLGNFGSILTRYRIKDRKYGATYNLFGVCLMKSETIDGFCQFCTIYGRALNCHLDLLICHLDLLD